MPPLSYPPTFRPCLLLLVQNKLYHTLVDSGSNISFIDRRVVDELDIETVGLSVHAYDLYEIISGRWATVWPYLAFCYVFCFFIAFITCTCSRWTTGMCFEFVDSVWYLVRVRVIDTFGTTAVFCSQEWHEDK